MKKIIAAVFIVVSASAVYADDESGVRAGLRAQMAEIEKQSDLSWKDALEQEVKNVELLAQQMKNDFEGNPELKEMFLQLMLGNCKNNG